MPEKHSTIRDGKRWIWFTERLWELSRDLVPFDVAIESIAELDQNCWFDTDRPTLREVAKHLARIEAADLSHPIVLNADGSLMDGGHRLCKAMLEGRKTISAVQFLETPEPDEVRDLET